MYYEDLAPYHHLDHLLPREPDTLDVGWLDADHPFPTGDAPEGLVDRLFELPNTPANRIKGYRQCELCLREPPIVMTRAGTTLELGDGKIRVAGQGGVTCAASDLVCHHVEAHRYRPPDELVKAVTRALPGR